MEKRTSEEVTVKTENLPREDFDGAFFSDIPGELQAPKGFAVSVASHGEGIQHVMLHDVSNGELASAVSVSGQVNQIRPTEDGQKMIVLFQEQAESGYSFSAHLVFDTDQRHKTEYIATSGKSTT